MLACWTMPMTQGDPAKPIVQLEYGDGAGPRPKWVYLVVGIYVLGWGVLLGAPAWWRLAEGVGWHEVVELAVLVSVLTVAGLSLMIVPVRRRQRRPVTRRSIWFPIVMSGLLLGILVISAGMAYTEYLGEQADFSNRWLYAAGTVWVGWSTVFIFLSGRFDPAGIGGKLHRWLIAGSVLELLVAVPTHIVVRRRPDCCAGMATGIAICVGVVVMFVALGPSVLVLFYRRWRRVAGK